MYKALKRLINYLQMHAIDILLTGTHVIEITVAAFLGIIVFVWSFKMLGQLPTVINVEANTNSLHEMLEICFSLIIVVEFVRMLIRHSMINVVEVLVFAIARGLIVDHEDPMNMLISVGCICLLLIIRKFTLSETPLKEMIKPETKVDHKP